MAQKPVFVGRHTVFHGFGRSANETAPGLTPSTWWGSDAFALPEGTRFGSESGLIGAALVGVRPQS